jgi:hypothetical protein
VLFTHTELSGCVSEAKTMKIPCLTLHGQWAAAIFMLGKDVENRTWSTPYRGPLAIHAGRNIDRSICKELGLDPDTVHLRAILGTVDLVDIVHDSRSPWAVRGHYHWVLKNPKLLAVPKPYSGRQGLFSVTL